MANIGAHICTQPINPSTLEPKCLFFEVCKKEILTLLFGLGERYPQIEEQFEGYAILRKVVISLGCMCEQHMEDRSQYDGAHL